MVATAAANRAGTVHVAVWRMLVERQRDYWHIAASANCRRWVSNRSVINQQPGNVAGLQQRLTKVSGTRLAEPRLTLHGVKVIRVAMALTRLGKAGAVNRTGENRYELIQAIQRLMWQ